MTWHIDGNQATNHRGITVRPSTLSERWIPLVSHMFPARAAVRFWGAMAAGGGCHSIAEAMERVDRVMETLSDEDLTGL